MESPPHPSLHVGAAVSRGPNRKHDVRRRRVPHRVPCRLSVFDTADEQVASYCAQTVNISADGLAVHVQQAIPEGTLIEALVPHLDGDPLRFQGRVLHSRRVLSGVFEVGIGRTGERIADAP